MEFITMQMQIARQNLALMGQPSQNQQELVIHLAVITPAQMGQELSMLTRTE